MDLIIKGENSTFNPEIVKRGGLIRAQHVTWCEPRNGLITLVGRDYARVLFLTGVNAAASYFTIRASEVAAGQWTILLTNDMIDAYIQRNAAAFDLVTEVRKLFKEETNHDNDD